MSGLVLWLDTNIAWNPRDVDKLTRVARRKGIPVVVHAQVHMERCRQLRARFGDRFNQRTIDDILGNVGIEVQEVSFDRATAEAWAELLHTRFPGESGWQTAKLEAVKARLPESTTPERVPMTTDWLVALEVERSGGFIAVNDQGPEWRHLREQDPPRAMRFEEALRWLESQPESPT